MHLLLSAQYMCTVTYYPLEKNQFVLTSNRDESPNRPHALEPVTGSYGNVKITFPKDPLGGGSWIAVSRNLTTCLLNGADRYHKKEGPYRISRGIVLLDRHQFISSDAFVQDYDFTGIEPFTLINIDHLNGGLQQIRWNGKEVELKVLNSEHPGIWSSHTLYTPEIIEERNSWFKDFMRDQKVTPDRLLDFHRFGGNGDKEKDLVMSRGGKVMTVSITQIRRMNSLEMRYNDLLNHSIKQISLDL
ncbi:MAG: hypothetical protein GC181_03785 [Bacteroidetes bacterium]|nr:hypothetical protein [Bacteroidota bacterium]